MEMFVYFNGNFTKASDAHVSIFDHGFLYGDGLFETLRIYEGVPFKFEEHMNRLFAGANYLKIEVPLGRSVIRKTFEVLLEKNNLTDGVARVMLTRGEGDISVDMQYCVNPTVLITVSPCVPLPDDVYENGVKLTVVSRMKAPSQVIDSTVKSNNYLGNILARAEAKEKGAFDGIMLSTEGYVAECPTSNIFMIMDDQLCTPAPSTGILKGVTRDTIVEIAHSHDIAVEEKFILPEDLYHSSECFLTSSVREIVPVSSCDGHSIGSGKTGLITLNLMKEYRRVVNDYLRMNSHVD